MTQGLEQLLPEAALAKLTDMTSDMSPISIAEFQQRLEKAQTMMKQQGADAMYLHAGNNLYYFTGLQWQPSERMVAAIIPAEGPICYVAPQFEIDTIKDYWQLPSEMRTWEEHESPYALVLQILSEQGKTNPTLLIDEYTPYFIVANLGQANPDLTLKSAQSVTQGCRQCKSPAELALIQRAHEMTMKVLQATASILRPGISTIEVTDFIDKAHRKVGATSGSFFAIALFGVATSFPHGVKNAQILKPNDWVLLDTGCQLFGYLSDITRSFCFGTPTDRQREVWAAEKAAQIAAFEAAKIGSPCELPDMAARKSLAAAGFGPDYKLPGLPHRTGHGCGLNIHEGPFLVRGDKTPLEVGMVLSNEPMLVLPGEFGCRLEDHFFMTENGPQWLTQPAESIEKPISV